MLHDGRAAGDEDDGTRATSRSEWSALAVAGRAMVTDADLVGIPLSVGRGNAARPLTDSRRERSALQVVACVAQVEALVGQRKIGDDRVAVQRDRNCGPIEP